MARRVVLPGVILLRLLGALLFFGLIQGDDSPCKRMQAAGGIGSKGILCIGQLTNDRLIVITRDYLVYQLPMSSLGSSVSKLYVNDTVPVPIAKKWPKIANNPDFTRVRAILYNAFFYVMGNQNLFFMTTKEADHPYQKGVTFDVDTQKGYRGLWYELPDDQVLIGSYMSDQFFAINKDRGALKLWQFHRVCDHSGQVVCNITHEYSWPIYNLCKKGDKEVTLKSSTDDCTNLGWPVLNGFISKGNFYLFGSDYVITFPEAIWHNPNVPVHFKTVPYGSFIQCGGGDAGRDSIVAKKHPPLSVGLIVAIVLLVLLLLLCCILCLMRQAALRKKKKNKKKYGSRSDWLVGFGMLTKASPRRSSSANVTRRSTQMSTAARKLSKKRTSPSVVPPKPPGPAPSVPPVVPPKPPGPGPNGPSIVPTKLPGPSGSRGSFQVTERSKYKGPSKGGSNNISARSKLKGHK